MTTTFTFSPSVARRLEKLSESSKLKPDAIVNQAVKGSILGATGKSQE